MAKNENETVVFPSQRDGGQRAALMVQKLSTIRPRSACVRLIPGWV
ncbi:hypothetical protein O9992_17795 [Vibrio lentus]|nr:hypothetical protein [Vibrio lentus]